MTYLDAAATAERAETQAKGAASQASLQGDQDLAKSVALLARAVKELAEAHHQAS